MLRYLLGLLLAAGTLGAAQAQTYGLPELGLQTSGTCRSLVVRDRSNGSLVPIGCLDTSTHAFVFSGLPSFTTYGANFVQASNAAGAKTLLALVKADVGLGSVDNTADAAKPVSTAAAAALALKAPLVSPALTGTPTAPTATSGTNTTQIATTAFVASSVGAIPGAAVVPACQGRLTYTNATTLTFGPYQGNQILIGGAYRTIPAAGVTASNSGAGANATGYFYAYWTGTAVAAERSTTVHVTDTTYGIDVKSGDASRTFIGAAYTNASSQFQDDPAFRGVASWCNRRWRPIQGANVNVSTSSTAVVELSTSARVTFWAWGDEAVLLRVSGYSSSAAGGSWNLTSIGVDGAAGANSSLGMNTASYLMNATVVDDRSVSEGPHYASPLVQVLSSAGTWNVQMNGAVRQ